MRYQSLKSALAMAVVAGTAILGGASPARAVLVTYSTQGVFADPATPGPTTGPSTINIGGARISFSGVTSNTVDAPSQASFGTFTTAGTIATSPVPLDAPFTLEIFQTAPDSRTTPLQFVGRLQGTLSVQNSRAYIQFNQSTLSQAFTGLFTTTYTIVEADRNENLVAIPGRSNLNPPLSNNGVSTLEGFIQSTPSNVIPEPSTLLMGAFAAPAVLIFLRRKGKVTS